MNGDNWILFGGSGLVTDGAAELVSTPLPVEGAVAAGVRTGGGGLKTFVTLSLMNSYMSSMEMVQSSGSNFLASSWLFNDAMTTTTTDIRTNEFKQRIQCTILIYYIPYKHT